MFSWSFLMLAEHPYGRCMLAELVAAGFVPTQIVQERSDVAELERRKFEVRMHGFDLAPAVDEILDGHDVERVFVGSHNDDDCHAALARHALDLLVLGGTRILEPRIFAHAPALNAHPGLLPEVRGSASVAWAIHLDAPVGCTCHFIEAGIDTGPIVVRRELAVRRGDTYQKLCHATTQLSATLMVEAVRRFVSGERSGTPQVGGGPAHRNMPDEMVAEVERKLARGRYRHFVD